MKRTYIYITFGLFSFFTANISLAQGSLTPPGAPAPTMKTLDQVQPRTPIYYGGFGISVPGSYVFTTNAIGISGANGINILCDNVTIDLNGFILQGVPGSISGINVSGNHTNITVRNGTIRSWEGRDGISGFSCENLVVEHVTISNNGRHGIAASSCIVSDCSIFNNQWNGIDVTGNGSRITHNTLTANNLGNHPVGTGGGIYVSGYNSLIEDNFVTGFSGVNGFNGIVAANSTFGNVIVKNCVMGWGTGDYSLTAANDVGPIGSATNSPSPWANFLH